MDVVCDVYCVDSLKFIVRERCGIGIWRRVVLFFKFYKNWKSFFYVSDNKIKLFLFLVKELYVIDIEGKEVYIIYGDVVFSF